MSTTEILKNLTGEQQMRLMSLEKLFQTEGWDIIMELASQQAELARDRCAYASSWDENRVANGQEQVWRQILALEGTTESEFAEIASVAEQVQTDLYEDASLDHQS